jgi:hypothetical protein
MLPKSSKVFNCEIVEDAKLVEREKYTFRCKNQTRYSRQRTSAKNSTRFSTDFRVRLAANAATANAATANAATQPENIRECRHEAGRYNKERRGLKRKQLRRPLPICIRRTRPTSFD